MQVRADQLRVALHFAKDAGERANQLGRLREIAIVGSGSPRVLPQSFRGIQLRRVRWELVDFQPMPIFGKPSPDVSILVVGSIVLNQNGSLRAIAPRQLLPESQVGGSIEDRVLAIGK